MLDCGRVNALRLRFPDRLPADLELGAGVHGVGRDTGGRLAATEPSDALVDFCIDRRGAWLKVRGRARGVHVNGRPVRRMAMLRAGDTVFVEGGELLLLGDVPSPAPDDAPEEVGGDRHVALRGVAGQYHGRCFVLDAPKVLGRARNCDIRLDSTDVAEHYARLEPHPLGIVLRDMGSPHGSVVNGHPVRHALLRAGDQFVVDANQRFIVEAANGSPTARAAAAVDDEVDGEDDADAEARRVPRSLRRMPWLIIAALLLAVALSLLLLYGVR